MSNDNSHVQFIDEDVHDDDSGGPSQGRWRVLIVDDDPDVHQATELALRGIIVQRRTLQLLHATSAAEALVLLRREHDIAVVLLDVVMETGDAGLTLVRSIRDDLGLHDTRIVLRTGQPGQAPELDAITRYDINDYKTKSELTRTKLFATLTTAVRSYDQICRLSASRRGLERIIAASNEFMAQQGLKSFAEGVIMQLASFIGVAPEGLVCASTAFCGGGASGEFRIVAAAGRYSELVCHLLSEVDDPRIVETLSSCLTIRENVVAENALALYFPGHHGFEFAAFIDTDAPVDELDRHLLEVFCSNIALCGENVNLVSRLRDFAYMDQLVGLANRTGFLDQLGRRLSDAKESRLMIALLDIDQFAEMNDMLGHAYGDMLLKGIAARLTGELPAECLIARVAGDGFAVLGDEDVVSPATLHALLEAPFTVDGADHLLSMSMGLVRIGDFADDGPNDLLKNAYIALKHAKSQGQRQSAYYSSEVALEIRDRTRLLSDLRTAFERGRLFVVYQPIFELSTRRMCGVEALLRWRTDEGDFVSPERFIPVAESSGLIVAMGAWVLRTALHAVRRISDAAGERVRMSVNVSVAQLRQSRFAEVVYEALHASGCAPQALELEVTESVTMAGVDQVTATLQLLRSRGVGIAIDDFGTGYSSLSYLDRLPAQRLKIDRAFTQALDSEQGARIVEMLVPLGHRLGMTVLAEGVENEAQAVRLQELGCDEAQGFHLARPMPLDALLEWMASR